MELTKIKPELRKSAANVRFQELNCDLMDRAFYGDLEGFMSVKQEADELIRQMNNCFSVGVKRANEYRKRLNERFNQYYEDNFQ